MKQGRGLELSGHPSSRLRKNGQQQFTKRRKRKSITKLKKKEGGDLKLNSLIDDPQLIE